MLRRSLSAPRDRRVQCLSTFAFMIGVALLSLSQGETQEPKTMPAWDSYSDTWVATDGLGRALPGHDQVGSPRPGKYAGIFYFLWLGQHSRQVYDNSKILAANPQQPGWGPEHAFHFWGEPLLGYYRSEDEFVLRRHAQMLAAAGVDVVFFDVTNAFTYDSVLESLFRVYEDLRRSGQATPQIAFMTHARSGQITQRLYDNLYAKGLHRDLWFLWQGKPLILATPGELTPALADFFTVRESWAWTNPGGWFGDGKDKWPWVDHTPQGFGWHEDPTKPEQICVCVAEHPTSNIGRSFHDGKQPSPDEITPERGLYFAEQWERALQVDPEFVFITGWNEWVAQRFVNKGNVGFLGRKGNPGDSYFVDQYNQEFSRDAEPMKGGHGDNYYYQMIAGIRRFKGVRPLPPVSPRPIRLDGSFDDWTAVQPEFRDHLGDPVRRDHDGWEGAGRYVNQTGRNDLVSSKVSCDAESVYFYARTREPLSPCTDPAWMMLFLDVDHDPATGWLGYDFVVNRTGVRPQATTLERNVGGRYEWTAPVEIPLRVSGCELELAIPRAALGLPAGSATLDFKWADNLAQTGDWSDFALNGDCAPDDRFNFRAQLPWSR